MRYRTRCHEFDAIRVTSDNLDEIRKFTGPHGTVEQQKIPGPGRGMTDGITIRTINDTVRVRVGDWVTRDDQSGRFGAWADTEFRATCEPVDQRD